MFYNAFFYEGESRIRSTKYKKQILNERILFGY